MTLNGEGKILQNRLRDNVMFGDVTIKYGVQ